MPSRPSGLSLVAVFWFMFGLMNVYFSFQTLSADLEALPFISSLSGSYAWLKFDVPAELVISIVVLVLGLLQIVTVPGLWSGKAYSYKLALVVSILLLICNVLTVMLIACTPEELNLKRARYLSFTFGTGGASLIISLFWVAIFWRYLNKPHMKT